MELIYFVASIMGHRGSVLTFIVMNMLLDGPPIVRKYITWRTQGNKVLMYPLDIFFSSGLLCQTWRCLLFTVS